MNRRHFLKTGAGAAAVLAGFPMLTTGCRNSLRSRLMDGPPSGSKNIPELTADGYRILYYASLAPSGHNAQPWFVKINDSDHWTIGLDPDRCLPVVDSSNTEAVLSIGTFLENLVQAAAAHGYQAHITMIAKDQFDPKRNPDLVSLKLERTQPKNMDMGRLTARRTVKSHLSGRHLTPEDVDAFSRLADGHLFYFASGTTHADHMAEQAVANYIIQMENTAALKELAEWTRLKDSTVKEHRDG
ncbi:MAG: twin-arginine translocation signal domain-containing protein, partial [Desulfotignum sp.]|nr:twin-arginine translocation signal domain-containing protein [Desulfotignum sp.]